MLILVTNTVKYLPISYVCSLLTQASSLQSICHITHVALCQTETGECKAKGYSLRLSYILEIYWKWQFFILKVILKVCYLSAHLCTDMKLLNLSTLCELASCTLNYVCVHTHGVCGFH